MPSNSAASSLTRSVDNTVVAVLLTVALSLLFLLVVGLLVFSLVELMGSAVVELAVLEFSSIVEILSLPFHSHHLFQQCKKGEQLSITVANILPTHLSLVTLLPPLLDTRFFHFLQILQRMLSLSHPVS